MHCQHRHVLASRADVSAAADVEVNILPPVDAAGQPVAMLATVCRADLSTAHAFTHLCSAWTRTRIWSCCWAGVRCLSPSARTWCTSGWPRRRAALLTSQPKYSAATVCRASHICVQAMSGDFEIYASNASCPAPTRAHHHYTCLSSVHAALQHAGHHMMQVPMRRRGWCMCRHRAEPARACCSSACVRLARRRASCRSRPVCMHRLSRCCICRAAMQSHCLDRGALAQPPHARV